MLNSKIKVHISFIKNRESFQEAEVALVALENVHLYKVIRVLSFIERIKGTEFPYMLSIGFPTSSEVDMEFFDW